MPAHAAATRRPTGWPRRQPRAGPTRWRMSTDGRLVSHTSPASRPRTDPAPPRSVSHPTSSQSAGTAPSEEPASEESSSVESASRWRALLPVADGARRHWFLLARVPARAAGDGVRRVLVVQLRQEADTPPPVHRVLGSGPPRSGGCGRGSARTGWEHPRAPPVRWILEGRAAGAVLELLEDNRVGC